MHARWFGYFRSDLAVDLGTANTLVARPGEGIVLDEPSVVAVARDSGRILSGGCAVGHLARQMLGKTPDTISVVRPLRDGVITDYEQCEAMLRYFLRKAQSNGPRRKPRVLVTVPGCITPVERRAVLNSVQRAGARQVLLIHEGRAAAIGAGLPVAEPVASMVCDIGAGTTETAVFSLGDMVAGRSIRTGGDRMDQAVVDYLRRRHGLRVGTAAAEQLRIDVGSAVPLARETAREIRGVDAASSLPRAASVTSEEVRHALADPLEEILDAVKAVLDGCSPELAADLVDRGIVLCGGGALLGGLDRYLAEQTGLPVRVAADPQKTVVTGALVCLENLARWRTSVQSGE
ncbi:MAG TPA: rod shape-determining protein [Thermoguttaceae bacterium]|nr:rod shape-determining protein [Thermoguttaceae bacterium]